MTDLEKPLLSNADADQVPSTSVLLERLRADGKQPSIKVPACPGCGQLHRGINAAETCIREALLEARAVAVLSTTERAELVELREKVDRLEKKVSNLTLQSRGVPRT